MGSDDGTIGRVLTRREALALLGAGGVAALGAGRPASAAVPDACVVRPALTEGPYFVDVKLGRSDIRSDPADGTLRPGVMVDVWHCDAAGLYSDVTDRGGSTVGRKFLRGYQTTGGDGRVAFTTIYPGAYPGRAVHVHFKVRTDAGRGRAHEFTSQLFFDDALTDQVHARPPYAAAARRMRNERDGIYRGTGGQLILAAAPSSGGYAAAFDLALEVG